MNEIDDVKDIADLMVELTKMLQRKLNRNTGSFSAEINIWTNSKPQLCIWHEDFWRNSFNSIWLSPQELATCLQQRNLLFRKFSKDV